MKFEMLSNFYSYNLEFIQVHYKIIKHFMEKKIPDFFNKFQELGVYSDSLLMDCVCTFFSKCAPMEFVS